MACESLGGMLNISEELIKTSCCLSLKVQNFPDKLFHAEKFPASSSHAFFSFPGSSSVDGWYSGDKAFGEKEINLQLFPSMKSIGNYNEAEEPRAQEALYSGCNCCACHNPVLGKVSECG
ncbi:protein EDS1L [Prunus yedoensis var. nudiflora]|uniref:Protein EDS1L n=1 Tax=Prunus yedoensis var. nudiflora TaxID=2094558 RepID=A0A314XSM5_PRUYE|nr:protein EDS1L [Prunus yedoensis var. nudiflora]